MGLHPKCLIQQDSLGETTQQHMLNLSRFRQTLDDIEYGLIAIDEENIRLLEQTWETVKSRIPEDYRPIIQDRIDQLKPITAQRDG